MSVLSLGALERIQEIRKTANRDGTKTGVEVCFACEPNGSDGCRRENLLHTLCTYIRPRVQSVNARYYRPGLPHIQLDWGTKMHFIKR